MQSQRPRRRNWHQKRVYQQHNFLTGWKPEGEAATEAYQERAEQQLTDMLEAGSEITEN